MKKKSSCHRLWGKYRKLLKSLFFRVYDCVIHFLRDFIQVYEGQMTQTQWGIKWRKGDIKSGKKLKT